MKKKDFVLVILLGLLFLSYFFNRGITYYDEGYILHAVQRVLGGEFPYRDFHFVYTPGILLILYPILALFGQNILVERFVAVGISLVSILVLFALVFRLSKQRLFSYLSVLLYLSWGPTHINFLWPTQLALLFGLLTVYFLVRFEQKQSIQYIVYAGIAASCTFLSKQNFGAAAFFSVLYFLIFHPPSLRFNRSFGWIPRDGELHTKKTKNSQAIRYSIFGITIPLMVFLFYLFATQSSLQFIHILKSFFIDKMLLGGYYGTPFPTDPIKIVFYLFPGIVSTLAFICNKQYRYVSLFTLLFYLLGVKPITDYVHVVFLIATIGIPLAIIGQTEKKHVLKIALVLYILFIGGGLCTALFKGYYRWEAPMIQQTKYLNFPKAQIYVEEKYEREFSTIISYVTSHTKSDDYVFSFFKAPLIYFLSDRKNPTYYIDLLPGLLTKEDEVQVIESLQKHNVSLVITHWEAKTWGNPLISDYILTKYHPVKTIGEFTIWEKPYLAGHL